MSDYQQNQQMALQAEQSAGASAAKSGSGDFLKPEPQRITYPEVPSATKSVAQTENTGSTGLLKEQVAQERRIWGEKQRTIKNREATTEQPAKPFPIASVPAAARLGRMSAAWDWL